MPNIRFYNSLTNQVEDFAPIDPPHVYMYNCGPTVYDYAHIGNFRSFVFADVLRRFLELVYGEGNVHQVMNFTDVGHMTDDEVADGGGVDKMEEGARRLKEAKKQGRADVDDPNDPYQVANFFIDAFLEDARALGMKIADEYADDPARTRMPRATDHVEPSMIPMIQSLLDKGHAYIAADGAIYFSVETFPSYGQLSGNTLDQIRGGAGGRVDDEHQAVKHHPADFLLWKPDESHLMKWPSPWGAGYPGWHIECSAMSRSLLGRDVIDIHTGGEDNIFPHHECEIAQSCGASGEDSFARFWIHARYLMVEGEKMSKSKQNCYTIGDLREKGIDPVVVRFELLKAHYRSNANFTFKGLEDSGRTVQKIRNTIERLKVESGGEVGEVDLSHPFLAEFTSALSDDLNMAGALGAFHSWLGGSHDNPAESLAVLERVDSVLGVATVETVASASDDDIDEKCKAIDLARENKDYAAADAIRAELIAAGYDVQTTGDGTSAQKKLA